MCEKFFLLIETKTNRDTAGTKYDNSGQDNLKIQVSKLNNNEKITCIRKKLDV